MLAILMGAAAFALAEQFPPVAFVHLNAETVEIFESQPPSAMDYAVFLLNLRKHAPRSCAVVPLWDWPDADPSALDLLAKQTDGLPLQLAAMLDNDAVDRANLSPTEAFPPGLKLEGDARNALPRFTSVAALPHARLRSGRPIGYALIDLGADAEIGQSGIRVPLIALGPAGQIVPALPLVVAVETLGLAWDQVRFAPGQSLLLGSEARPIPVDTAGRVLVPFDAAQSIAKIPGEAVLSSATDGSVIPVAPLRDAVVILGDNRAEARLFPLPSGGALSRAELIAWSVHTLLKGARPPAKPKESTGEASGAAAEYRKLSTAQPEITYQFPDLRAPNIGLWIIATVWASLLAGSLRRIRHPGNENASPPGVSAASEPGEPGEPGEDGASPAESGPAPEEGGDAPDRS